MGAAYATFFPQTARRSDVGALADRLRIEPPGNGWLFVIAEKPGNLDARFDRTNTKGMRMAKKTLMREAADAVKTVAGAALGAAAAAATGVVVSSVAGAIRSGGRKLDQAAPSLEKTAAQKVAKPILPKKQKRAAAKRKATMAKKKVAAQRAAKKKRTSVRRKKR